jgi:hypothetical protein
MTRRSASVVPLCAEGAAGCISRRFHLQHGREAEARGPSCVTDRSIPFIYVPIPSPAIAARHSPALRRRGCSGTNPIRERRSPPGPGWRGTRSTRKRARSRAPPPVEVSGVPARPRDWTPKSRSNRLIASGPGSSVGRATDFKWEPRAGRNRTATSGCRSLLGHPESPRYHNVAGDGKRDGSKKRGIGRSAGKGPTDPSAPASETRRGTPAMAMV